MLLIEYSFSGWGPPSLPGHVARSTKRFVSVARYNNMERVNSGAGDINIFDEKFKGSVGLGGSEEHNQACCR